MPAGAPRKKAKPHKGLLKRVRITKNGNIKFQKSGGRHLRSNKNGEAVRDLRRGKYLDHGDVKRISALLIGHLSLRKRRAARARDAAKAAAAEKSAA